MLPWCNAQDIKITALLFIHYVDAPSGNMSESIETTLALVDAEIVCFKFVYAGQCFINNSNAFYLLRLSLQSHIADGRTIYICLLGGNNKGKK